MKIFSCLIPLEKRTKYKILFEIPIKRNAIIRYFSKYDFISFRGSVGIRHYNEETEKSIEDIINKIKLDWVYKSNIAELITSSHRPEKLIFIQYDGHENKKINVLNYIIFKVQNLSMNKIESEFGEELYYNNAKDFMLLIDFI